MIKNFQILFCAVLLVFINRVNAQTNNFIDINYCTIHSAKVGFGDFLKEIENLTKCTIFYPNDTLLTNKLITVSFDSVKLRTVLDKLLSGSDYSYLIYPPRNIIIAPQKSSFVDKSDIIQSDNNIQIGNILDRGKYRSAVISGKVLDGKTGNPIIGAVVFSVETGRGTVTNVTGSYSLDLPTGKHELEITSMGFEKGTQQIELISTGNYTIELFEESIKLEEVVISRKRVDRNISQAQMGTIELSAKEISSITSFMGEADVIKSLTLMPGVKTIGEAASGFNIRGGNVDQNLILIEDVPVFNTSHLFGFFSTIHPGAISDVTLYKGNVPAGFGGRISSVMDIGVKDANMTKFTMDGGIGLINARLTVETPIVKNKVSIIAGARSTYSDWILRRLPDATLQESQAGYYDIISKLKWLINSKNNLSLFYYKSLDKFDLANTSKYEYGNELGSFKYNHVFNSRLHVSVSAISSRYAFHLINEKYIDDPGASDIKSDINVKGGKVEFSYVPHIKHSVIAGIEVSRTELSPGHQVPRSENSLVVESTIENENSVEMAAYVSDIYEVNSWLTINAGIRYSLYQYLGPKSVYHYQEGVSKSIETITDTIQTDGVIAQYQNPEPRLSIRIAIDKFSSIKLGYSRSSQYLQLLTNTAAVTPTDVWKLSDNYIKPLVCDQFSFGYFRNYLGNTIESSAEIYYKDINNLIDYKNGAIVIMNNHIETDIVNGVGKSYGIELMLKKNTGRLTGWLGYTYSRTLKKSTSKLSEEQINMGQYYAASYDKPNDITTTVNYQISRRWSVSGNFTYSTGRPVTLPEYQFTINKRSMIYFSDRNKYRLPDYHRLDVSLTYTGHIKSEQRWNSGWTLSVFNVYGRNNPYSVYYTKDQPTAANGYREYALYKLSIVDRPIFTITYNFRF